MLNSRCTKAHFEVTALTATPLCCYSDETLSSTFILSFELQQTNNSINHNNNNNNINNNNNAVNICLQFAFPIAVPLVAFMLHQMEVAAGCWLTVTWTTFLLILWHKQISDQPLYPYKPLLYRRSHCWFVQNRWRFMSAFTPVDRSPNGTPCVSYELKEAMIPDIDQN